MQAKTPAQAKLFTALIIAILVFEVDSIAHAIRKIVEERPRGKPWAGKFLKPILSYSSESRITLPATFNGPIVWKLIVSSPRPTMAQTDSQQLNGDANQVPFDFTEIVASFAPRPFLAVAAIGDSDFDVSGVRGVIDAAQPIYELLGAS